MFFAIVPAYNEAKRIESVIRDLEPHVDRVVVIDDASSDDTVKRARAAGATVLEHRVNRGQGAALQTGHEYSLKQGAEYVLHFDGDGQFDVRDIQVSLNKLKEQKADILFGSRYLDTNSEIPWFKRFVIHPISRFVNRLFGAPKLSDAHNGFRILNRNALTKIVISQDRMAHATQIPVLAKKQRLRIVEQPVTVTYHEYGQRAVGGFQVLKDLLFGKFV